MRKHPFLLLGAVALGLVALGQSTEPRLVKPEYEPVNLSGLQTLVASDAIWFAEDKQRLAADAARLDEYEKQLIAYHDCRGSDHCYAADVDAQIEKAIAYLDQRVARRKPDEKLAIVLDIDETSLSNWKLQLEDKFNYVGSHWEKWYVDGHAPAIEGTHRLFEDALLNHVDVFFITGRGGVDTAVTEGNLVEAGYTDKLKHKGWTYLYTRPDQIGTVSEYKARMRADIETGTWKDRIIVNVGDQLSDMAGSPQAELSVKLPNPFYLIP